MLFALMATTGLLAHAADKVPAKAQTGAVAVANAAATEAGLEALRKGGNAVDAAVAVTTARSVEQPEASGRGGGFLAMIHDADSDKNSFIDAREVAPKAVDQADYRDSDGSPYRDTSLNGPLAAGIPGRPAGVAHMAGKYGKLPLKVSLAPAMRLAEQDDGKNAGEITAQKRIHHPYLPDRIDVESGSLPDDVLAGLKAMGHEINDRESWGNMNVVVWDKTTNIKSAASDPRSHDGLGKVETIN